MSLSKPHSLVATLAVALLSACAFQPCFAADSMKGETVEVATLLVGFRDLDKTKTTNYCSYPKSRFTVVGDNGTDLIVSLDTQGKVVALPADCTAMMADSVYTVPKTTLDDAKYVAKGLVAGVLVVPFKFHISNRSVTAGSTIGGYLGWRTSWFDSFTFTPIISGGLALISTQPAQAAMTPSSGTPSTSNTQTISGFSVATGLIGTVANGVASGTQYGLLIGIDWVGRSANYQYEGKPWLAFEIGYNFEQ